MVHGLHHKSPRRLSPNNDSIDSTLVRRGSAITEQDAQSRSMNRSILKHGMKDDMKSRIDRYRERLSVSEIDNPLKSIDVATAEVLSPPRHSILSGYEYTKERHAMPEGTVKSFLEKSRMKNQVSIQGEIMIQMNQDDVGIQPPRNFAHTSHGAFKA